MNRAGESRHLLPDNLLSTLPCCSPKPRPLPGALCFSPDSPSCIPVTWPAAALKSLSAVCLKASTSLGGMATSLFSLLFPGAAMEKSYMSMFLLLIAISCALAKDAGKKETKETTTKPKLPQTLSRGKNKRKNHTHTHTKEVQFAKVLTPLLFHYINFLATQSANTFSSIS